MFYVGRRYSARVEGATWKPVRCDRCQAQWAYQVKREYTGQGVSPYMLDNAGAASRAQSSANQGLERALEQAKDDVPCPRCLAYQNDMATRLKKSKFAWMFALGMIALFGTLSMVAPLVVAPDSPFPQAVGIGLMLAGFGTGIALLVGRSRLMAAFDPNAEELRMTRQSTLAAKKTILREQYEALVAAARADGRADDLVQISWS